MRRLLLCAVLAATAATLHAAIMYTAIVPVAVPPFCSNCVTVTVSWANEPPPGISFVVVNDSSGNLLFALNGPPFPQTTGMINPNPQTIFGLSPDVMQVITNGQLGTALPTSVGTKSPNIAPALNTFAELELENPSDVEVDGTVFVATPDVVPEPAVWSLTAIGLALLGVWMLGRKLPA